MPPRRETFSLLVYFFRGQRLPPRRQTLFLVSVSLIFFEGEGCHRTGNTFSPLHFVLENGDCHRAGETSLLGRFG
jgi:hypothetical protein